ncbi:unnamed protein product [Orchesella dallaii]|uniref:Solute carrier family 23 member 2 n=1 Tax=Orchesella dallaii TaxID=48710 RepID=A0ABP1PN66_9HEXA
MDNPGLELGSENGSRKYDIESRTQSAQSTHQTPVFIISKELPDIPPSANGTIDKVHDKHEATEEEPLLYGLLDVPPWYISIFLGFQHYLEMIAVAVAVPFLLTPALCMVDDDPDKANIISTLVFMSGIITVLQSTIGTMLPIVQGGSFSYLVPSLAIMNLPRWKCPDMNGMSPEQKTEEWQIRMREIQGAIIFAALFETIFALTGCIGFFTKFITPITVAPAITLIGLSLFKNVTDQCSKNYYVAGAMCLLLIIFSQHLRNWKIPTPWGSRGADGRKSRFPVFQVFPVLLSLIVVWGVCGILTAANVLPEGDPARVDAKKKIFYGSPWFRIPYPFQWGIPTVSIGAVLGVLCGVMTSTIESIGDYYACATIVKTTVPPEHAMNRGIFMEGFGCVMSGIMGSGNASTSYSNNIGTIVVTKVASRRVIQYAGVIMIALSLVGKAGAVFVALPDPILGGMFLFLFPLIMAVGIGTLGEVNLESSRNIFIVSFSIFFGLAVSQWMNAHTGIINTGTPDLDSLIQILLSTGMFVAGFTAFILDNTISGTDEERGLTGRHAAEAASKICRDTSYDLPFGMSIIKKLKICKWIPISPTYEEHPIKLLKRCRSDEASFDSTTSLPTYNSATSNGRVQNHNSSAL